jgi:hypothetical protein
MVIDFMPRLFSQTVPTIINHHIYENVSMNYLKGERRKVGPMTWHHIMKTYGGTDDIAPYILNLGNRWG